MAIFRGLKKAELESFKGRGLLMADLSNSNLFFEAPKVSNNK
jgi:hypothetical protein